MRHLWLMTTSMVLLSGCGSFAAGERFLPTPTSTAIELPTSESGNWVEPAPEDLPQTDWVAGFSDPILPELIDEALANNADIGAALARYDRALTQLKNAQADRGPTISGRSRAARSEPFGGGGVINIPGGGQIPVGGGTTNLSFGLDATWEPDVWGRIRDTINASEETASATAADLAGARLLIAQRVSQTWFDIIEARLLVELSVRDVETQDRALRLTQRRFEGGVTGSSDVRLARSAVANAQALQSSRKQRLSSLTRGLEILLRRYPADAIEAAADLPSLPGLSGAAAPGYLLTRRPDLLASERRMRAAGLNVDVARKNLLPRLSLSAGLDSSGSGLSDIFRIDNIISNFAGNLSQPIFQGGALRANVETQRAILREQMEQYTGTLLNAYLEVENALDGETRLAEREAALRVSLSEAQRAEERLEQRYVEGLATILQLLDAQSRRINAEGQLITARKDRLTNRVALHVALGGGEFGQEITKGVDDVVPKWKLNILSRDE